MGYRLRRHHGFTLPELIVVLGVLFMLFCLILVVPFFGRALSRRACSIDKMMTCDIQVKQLYQSWILWGEHYRDQFPTPMDVNRELSLSAHNPGNSTANIHSLMIYNNLYSPELIVCPFERNSAVFVIEDYDYDIRTQDAPSGIDGWDASLRCDVDGIGESWSNVSYANMDISHANAGITARDLSSRTAILGDRGPKDGQHDPGSASNMNHGTQKEWSGNVVFADLHVETLDEQVKSSDPFAWRHLTWTDAATGKQMPDNLFFRDDPVNRSDSWLAVFTSATGEEIGGTKVAWD